MRKKILVSGKLRTSNLLFSYRGIMAQNFKNTIPQLQINKIM